MHPSTCRDFVDDIFIFGILIQWKQTGTTELWLWIFTITWGKDCFPILHIISIYMDGLIKT